MLCAFWWCAALILCLCMEIEIDTRSLTGTNLRVFLWLVWVVCVGMCCEVESRVAMCGLLLTRSSWQCQSRKCRGSRCQLAWPHPILRFSHRLQSNGKAVILSCTNLASMKVNSSELYWSTFQVFKASLGYFLGGGFGQFCKAVCLREISVCAVLVISKRSRHWRLQV